MASINCSLQEEVPTTRDTLAFFSNLSTTFCNQVKHNLNLNGLNMITINCFTMDCIFKALISRNMICHWSQSKLDNFHHKFSLYHRWTHFLTSFTILTLNYHYSVHENFSWQDSDISYPKLSSLWWSRTLFLVSLTIFTLPCTWTIFLASLMIDTYFEFVAFLDVHTQHLDVTQTGLRHFWQVLFLLLSLWLSSPFYKIIMLTINITLKSWS